MPNDERKEENSMKFEMGEVVKDRVTGFKGVILAQSLYFTGCRHYGLCAQGLKDERPIPWEWFDETRLVKVKGAKKVVMKPREERSGPHPNAPQM